MKKLRVLILMHDHLVPPEEIEGVTPQQMAPWKMEFDVREALRELGHDVMTLGVTDELAPVREAVEEFMPHVAFNLLAWFHDVALYEAHVASYLELMKQPYTGCNPRGLLLAGDKALCKKILTWHRIHVPVFSVFPRGRAVRKPRRLQYPVIVKSTVEHSSAGISQASIVESDGALRERVGFVHRNLGTDALAERYIAGREFYVGVLGNQRLQVLPVWELTFENLPETSEPIATQKVKFDLEYQKRIGVRTGPAAGLDEAKLEGIRRIAKRLYRALGLSGYARVDMRMDAEGRVYVIEANTNPDLSFGEDFAESARRAGMGYLDLIQRVVNLGLRYHAPWKDHH